MCRSVCRVVWCVAHECIEQGPPVESSGQLHSVLQCVQIVAVCCSVLHVNILKKGRVSRVVVSCSVLQCFAVCCSVLQCFAVCCSVLQCFAVCCSVLRANILKKSQPSRVMVCCSVAWCVVLLQCVAACCTTPTILTFQKEDIGPLSATLPGVLSDYVGFPDP